MKLKNIGNYKIKTAQLLSYLVKIYCGAYIGIAIVALLTADSSLAILFIGLSIFNFLILVLITLFFLCLAFLKILGVKFW